MRERQNNRGRERILYTNLTILKPLTGKENNLDYLVIMAYVKGWSILGSKKISCQGCCVGGRKNGQL